MKNTILISLLTLSVVFFSACCGDCNGIFLGSFRIKEDSKTWIAFANTDPIRFQGPGFQTAVFQYSFPAFNLTPDVFNCAVDDCGTCCDEYENEVAAFNFSSQDLNVNFTLSLQPDFINYSPTNEVEEVGDYITIGMSGELFGDLFLEDPLLQNRVTIGGTEFLSVFVRERDRATLDTTTREPWAYYFTQDRGIVAFKFANGEEWTILD